MKEIRGSIKTTKEVLTFDCHKCGLYYDSDEYKRVGTSALFEDKCPKCEKLICVFLWE